MSCATVRLMASTSSSVWERKRCARLSDMICKALWRVRVLFLLEDANGIHGRSAIRLEAAYRLLESFRTLVVFAVGHHENDFLLQLRVFLQVIG